MQLILRVNEPFKTKYYPYLCSDLSMLEKFKVGDSVEITWYDNYSQEMIQEINFTLIDMCPVGTCCFLKARNALIVIMMKIT